MEYRLWSTSLGGEQGLNDLHGGDAKIAIVGSIHGVAKTLGAGDYWWDMCGVGTTRRMCWEMRIVHSAAERVVCHSTGGTLAKIYLHKMRRN